MSQLMLVVGEALLDTVHGAQGAVITEAPGGSPMNVAIGLGRLGHDVVLASRFGTDAGGRLIASHLEASAVRVIPAGAKLARTSRARAVVGEDGSAAYEFDLTWDLDAAMVPQGPLLHVHTGSIGATLQPGARAVLEVLRYHRERGASVSYDPNARPAIMGSPDDVRSQMESILALSDVVKASDEDIHWLYPTLTLPQVVAHWHSLGPDIVVITRGAEGVFASTRAHRITLPTRATRVVDTIGAGDSFMAGMLHALAEGGFLGGEARSARVALSEEQLTRVISSGLTCAAVTVSRAGANPPTLSELAKVG